MNGFNPLGGLKTWHIVLCAILALIGFVLGILKLLDVFVWCYNHIKIN